MVTKYQVETVEISRSQIKNAPYNPRKISDTARKKLKKNIKSRGLMGGIVVNRPTMNLVSGHQRISVLDELEQTEDYTIRVEMVELSDQEEKEQNIFMNNQQVQGTFDEHLLSLMIPEIDYKLAGLDEYDLNMLGVADIVPEPEADDVFEEVKQITKPAEQRKADVKAIKQQVAERAQSQVEQGESYFIMSFDSYEHKAGFMARFGYEPLEKFVKGEEFGDKVERID
jgi:ParB-like chromosome segregation protein Spo0J